MVWATSLLNGNITDNRKDQANAQLQALEIFEDYIMKNSSIITSKNGKKYQIEWIKINDNSNLDNAKRNTIEFCENDDVKVMFYTPLGEVSTGCLEYIDANCSRKIGMGANGLSNTWYLDKQRIFSIPPITEVRYVPILPFVNALHKHNKKTKVAVLYNTPHIFFDVVCKGLLDEKLKTNYGYEVVADLIVEYSTQRPPSNITKGEIETAVKIAKDRGAEAVLACFTDPSGIYFLKHLKEKKYDFDLVAVTTTSPNYFLEKDKTYMDYIMWVDDYIPQIDKGNDEYFGNASAFDEYFYKRYKKYPLPSVYRNLYAYITVMKAVQNAESDSHEDLMTAMTRTDYETIVGRLSYDSYHRTSIKASVIQTRFNGTAIETVVVGPPKFANAVPILPIPRYSERVYDPSFTTQEYAFLAIALFLIACSLASGIAIIVNRHHPIIRSAAPLFMLGIIVGSIFIYIGSIFFRVHQLSDATCHVQVWFLSLGFILMFGCLFAKSFRVWRLWNANLAKPTQVITDSQLGIIVGLLTSVQLILLIIYSVAGDVKKAIYLKDPYRPIDDVEYCTNNTVGLVILVLIVLYGFLLMAFGIFLAWTTRKVPFLAFNESKVILFSMYNVAIFTLLALIVVLNAREMDEQTEFVLHSICILLSSFFTVSISVGNKFYLMLHGKTNKSKTQSISQKNPTKSTTDPEHQISMVEYDTVAQENEELKAKINNLQSKVGEFEE